jgi:hypothetical protein
MHCRKGKGKKGCEVVVYVIVVYASIVVACDVASVLYHSTQLEFNLRQVYRSVLPIFANFVHVLILTTTPIKTYYKRQSVSNHWCTVGNVLGLGLQMCHVLLHAYDNALHFLNNSNSCIESLSSYSSSSIFIYRPTAWPNWRLYFELTYILFRLGLSSKLFLLL